MSRIGSRITEVLLKIGPTLCRACWFCGEEELKDFIFNVIGNTVTVVRNFYFNSSPSDRIVRAGFQFLGAY